MGANEQRASAPNLSPDPGARRTIRSSILLKLTAFVSGLLVLTAGALIFAGYTYTRQLLLDQIKDRLRVVGSNRRVMLLDFLRQQNNRVALVAGRSRLPALLAARERGTIPEDCFREEVGELFSDVRESSDGLLDLWVTDQAGTVVAATDAGRVGRDLAGDPDFRQGRAGRHMGLPVADGGRYEAVIAAPVVAPDGKALGVLMAKADMGPLVRIVLDANGLGETGEVVVATRRGDQLHYLLPSRRSPRIADVPDERSPPMAEATRGGDGYRVDTDYRGVAVLAAFRGIGYGDWGLVAKMDVEEAYAPVRQVGYLLALLELGSLVLGVLGAYALARRFSRPVIALSETAARVAAGDLAARVDVSSTDELGALGAAFNRMTEELSRSYATLESRVAERTRDLEASRDLLDEFFTISTSLQDPGNLEKTFDSVLRFCTRLGYDLAMLALVDRDRRVIRGVRALGAMAGIVGETVRPLDGDDILAVVAREGRSVVVPDATADPRCDPAATAAAGVRGLIVVPLKSGEVLGTLQVATGAALDPAAVDLRPLEMLANQAARALFGLRQLAEIRQLNRQLEDRAGDLIRSEASLLRQTQILQSILDCMGDGVAVADQDGRFLLFNPAAQRILNMGPEDMPAEEWSRRFGLFLPDAVTPYPPDQVPLARAIRGESVGDRELFIRHTNLPGGIWISVTAQPLRDDRGALRGGVAVFRDITERKRAEQRLAVQHATTWVLAESSTLGDVSPRILEAIGTGLGCHFGALWRLEPREQVLRCVATWQAAGEPGGLDEQTRQVEFAAGAGLPGRVRQTGRPCWIEDIRQEPGWVRRASLEAEGLTSAFGFPILLKGEVVGVVEFYCRDRRPPDEELIDVLATLGSQIGQFLERHQMHLRLIQSERLASLGLMSAGVAHEINNPLAFIGNNLAVIEREIRHLKEFLAAYDGARAALRDARPEVADEIDRLAEEIDLDYLRDNIEPILASTRQGVRRVAEIVHNLRGFARVDRAGADRADIHDAIHGGLEMIRGRLARRGISVEEKFGDLPPVSCVPAQLNQVFLNLLVNAMQAIETTGRADGRIEICTRAGDGVVVVEVADNGCGIPPDKLPHIFDPFFTTKSVGEGTGLGLSITHGIVSDHGGRIEVDSTPGLGTRFRVILPTGDQGKPR